MRSLIISASPRSESSSIRVARAIERLLTAEGVPCGIVDFRENDIPRVGRGSLNMNDLTPFQKGWVHGLELAQLVFCVVPEYNWSLPGEWLDALHQTGVASFAHLFGDKIFATVGVSSGRGGRRPALLTNTVLNKLISFLDQESVVSPGIFESHETGDCLNESGESLGNAAYDAGLKRCVDLALRTTRRWQATSR